MTTTIAHFCVRKALARAAPLALFLAVSFGTALFVMKGDVIGFLTGRGKLWLPYIAIAWTCGLILLFLLFALCWQLLFDKKRAIWVRRGKIVFLNEHYIAIRSPDVLSISTSTYGNFNQRGVRIELLGGRSKIIPTGSLCESGDAVAAKLREVVFKGPNQSTQ